MGETKLPQFQPACLLHDSKAFMISFHGHSFTKITCFQMINALHDTKCLNHIHDPMPFLLYTRLGRFKASDGPHRHTHNIASVRKLWQLNRVALLCIFSWAISTFTSDPVRLVRVVLINEDVTPMSMKYSPPLPPRYTVWAYIIQQTKYFSVPVA